ncbi:MAG: HNH endonuclease signature motif containing protein [Adlercreutzia sp.]|nr:HNH endonuclease signature motif containing protein [Adlercreutzia sp.]
MLKKKDIWDEIQMSQATRKARDLSRADTAKTKPGDRNGSASKKYKDEYGPGSVPDGYDVDHVIDLQLGGIDHVSNMRPLDASVNRSMGAQIHYLIKDLPEGTKIGNVIFE